MAPRFKPPRPGARLVARYDAHRDKADDPFKIAYSISYEAARTLRALSRLPNMQAPPGLINGYVARHLVEKGVVKRLPGGEGRSVAYRMTLRGEGVMEFLPKRFPELFRTP